MKPLAPSLVLAGVLCARAVHAQASERDQASPPEASRAVEDDAADARARDRLLVPAAAVPPRGSVRVDVRGGVERTGDGTGEGATGLGTIVVLGSVGHGVGLEASGRLGRGDVSPGAAIRYQVLAQGRGGVLDATIAARYGSFGLERSDVGAGMVGAELTLGRTFGKLALTASALVGRGIASREDVDGTFAGAIGYALGDTWQVGMEGRARTELEDRYDTIDDHGRPFELTLGAAVAHGSGPVHVQMLGGYQAPRGLAAPGPVGLAGMSVTF
ncbi:MAG: hypothetical protein JWP97_1593 [Labilithrix sp.]|nr:hypothetical protein [Labilithrix sp.]